MKKLFIGIGVLAVVIVIAALSGTSDKQPVDSKNTADLNNRITLQDAHGLAVDRQDSSKLYIATHTGILMLSKDTELQRVGTARDDYMGFSTHPTDANTFFSSGHLNSGGNIGFQKTTDGGKSWQKISDGAGGPVDFHAMTVSQADPNIVYGVFMGQLQRSYDAGKTWGTVNTKIGNIITLSTNTASADTVYAGTTNGLYVSQNRGNEWNKINGINGAITAVAVNPNDSQNIMVYSDNQGLIRSIDGLNTWTALKGYSGNTAMHLTSDTQNPSILYLINQALEIHKTANDGETWTKIR